MKKRSGSREGGCRKILESCFTGHRGSRERLSGKIKKKSFISAFWVDKRWILVISLNVLQSWLPVLLSSFSSSYTFFLLAPLQSTTSFPYLSSSVYILLFSLFVIFFSFRLSIFVRFLSLDQSLESFVVLIKCLRPAVHEKC